MNITIAGYDIVALAACDHGHVLTLNNNSDHYIVVEVETAGSDFAGGSFVAHVGESARLVGTFTYDVDANAAYRLALQKMADVALSHCTDMSSEEACPTCGNKPGDGVGCNDPEGCGFGR